MMNFSTVLLIFILVFWSIAASKTLEIDLSLERSKSEAVLEFDLKNLNSRSLTLRIFCGASSSAPIDKLVAIKGFEGEKLLGFLTLARLRVNWTNVETELKCLDYITYANETICHNVTYKTLKTVGSNIRFGIHLEPSKFAYGAIAEVFFTSSYSDFRRAISAEEGNVALKKNKESEFRNYFIPTGAIFFLIWGFVTLARKCYLCYRAEYGKDEFY